MVVGTAIAIVSQTFEGCPFSKYFLLMELLAGETPDAEATREMVSVSRF